MKPPPAGVGGLTLSDAFRLLLTRVAREKALPFEPLTPNEKPSRRCGRARREGFLPLRAWLNFGEVECAMSDWTG